MLTGYGYEAKATKVCSQRLEPMSCSGKELAFPVRTPKSGWFTYSLMICVKVWRLKYGSGHREVFIEILRLKCYTNIRYSARQQCCKHDRKAYFCFVFSGSNLERSVAHSCSHNISSSDSCHTCTPLAAVCQHILLNLWL